MANPGEGLQISTFDEEAAMCCFFLSDRFFHVVPLGRRNIDESLLSSFYGKHMWFIERMTHNIFTFDQTYLPGDSKCPF